MGRALRWSGYFGDVDLALSHFTGIGRDARFLPQADGRLKADYSHITQNGIDVQYLRIGSYDARIIGIEHSFYDFYSSGYDVVMLAEFATDSRKLDSHTGFQKDIISGARLLFNDAIFANDQYASLTLSYSW